MSRAAELRVVPAKVTHLIILADRVEREEPSTRLDDEIWELVRGVPAYTEGEPFKAGNPPRRTRLHGIPRYTSDVDGAKNLEPLNAQEIVVRIYPGDKVYVRITTAGGRAVYSEWPQAMRDGIGEARARCAAALRAMAEGLK